MSNYYFPIIIAFIAFGFIAFIATLPWAIYQYRKYNYFSFWKSFLLASFIFYSLSAYFLVILPLPEVRENCTELLRRTTYMQTNFFQFIDDIKRESNVVLLDVSTYKQIIRVPAFYQLVFNIMLLFPLGIYIRYLWPKFKHIWKAVLIGFGTSLFFELTQLSGLFGFYKCPYRLFDVDDLLANTTGTTLGFMLAPLFLLFIPSKQNIEHYDVKQASRSEASRGTELLALFIDITVAKIVAKIVSALLLQPTNYFFFVTLFVMIILIPTLTKGHSVGSYILNATYESTKGNLVVSLFKRYIAILVPLIASRIVGVINEVVPYVEGKELLVYLSITVMSLLFLFVVIVHLLIRFLRKKKPFYFDEYSGITTVRRKKK